VGIDGHFLRLDYNETLDRFVGISWPYVNGGNKKLKYLNPNSGLIERVHNIGQPTETEFAKDGRLLITSNREILDLENGIIKNWI